MGRDRAPRRQFKRVALAEFQARALRYLPTCRKEIYEALCRIASTDEGVLPFIDRYLDRTEGRSGRKVQQPAAHTGRPSSSRRGTCTGRDEGRGRR